MMNFNEFWTKKTLIGLGLGQFLSLLITSTGFTSSELSKRVVKAYQYTSLTSVMLLDCWSIPSVMVLTWIFLKTKYRFRKIVGVLVCVAGLVVVIFSDVHAGDRAGGSNPLKGDALVIAGATLYAISNVSEEFLVKNADRVELLAMLGLFGAIISAIQISILERSELKSINWSAGASNGSTMLNLSLLTSDMWSVLIRVFAYNEKVDWMYFVAFAAVTIGLVIYSGGEKEDQRRAIVADEDNERSKRFDEEAGSASRNQGTVDGSWKMGQSNQPGTASTSATERGDSENMGKDIQGKKS
ncbi:hypothetical protein I3760_02G056500 [Carya illinoinensis]|nr:hypothetical protein I3760_02G056500 [Carya illinoinensis]